MDTSTRILLANLAGSFLLLVAFLLLAVSAVVLFMLWRGLAVVRPELVRLVREAGRYVREADVAARQTLHAVITPQIRIASSWVGLKAGARALVGRADRSARQSAHEGPPTPPVSL